MEDSPVDGIAHTSPRRSLGWWRDLGPVRNLILFLLTSVTTYLVGGPVYSATLMTILTAHEMGHFLMSRRYRVPTSLPFFIPFLPPFGTLGAVIKMHGRMVHRRALFDVAVAGPLAGFFFTVPAVILGLRLSSVIPLSQAPEYSLQLGESLLFSMLSKVAVGSVPEGFEVVLHPVAYAGWIGLYVMALNLLPIGQLDGGHVVYALLGRGSRFVFLGAMIIFAMIARLLFLPWLFLIALILFLRLFKHPPPQDDVTTLNTGRKLIGLLVLLLFVLSFPPVPFPGLF